MIFLDFELEDISILQGYIPNLKVQLIGYMNIATSKLPKEGFWEIDAKQLQLFSRTRTTYNGRDSETSYDEGYRLGFAQGFNNSEQEYESDESINE